jgi:hypothetical protein
MGPRCVEQDRGEKPGEQCHVPQMDEKQQHNPKSSSQRSWRETKRVVFWLKHCVGNCIMYYFLIQTWACPICDL